MPSLHRRTMQVRHRDPHGARPGSVVVVAFSLRWRYRRVSLPLGGLVCPQRLPDALTPPSDTTQTGSSHALDSARRCVRACACAYASVAFLAQLHVASFPCRVLSLSFTTQVCANRILPEGAAAGDNFLSLLAKLLTLLCLPFTALAARRIWIRVWGEENRKLGVVPQ